VRRSALLIAVLAALVLACGQPRPVATAPAPPPVTVTAGTAGGQLLAISTVPRLQPPPAAPDYLTALDEVRQAGATASFESATWSDADQPAGFAKLTDAVESAHRRGQIVLLNLKVIDTTVLAVPADLARRPIDQLTTRFHALVDRLQPHLAGVRYLAVGNEVDVYLSAHPQAWNAYLSFLTDAAAYVHRKLPGVAVGVTSTFDGARGASAAEVARLNTVTDVEILTYYPLGARFVPRPPATAGADLDQMLTIAGRKPLVLQEVGYPSAAQLASSEQAQAAFVTAVTTAWHRAGDRIPLLNWFALGDFTPQICDEFSLYYLQPHDVNFRAYLCSLGLRRVDGTPKPAWTALLHA
jgi:hypothetical protein